LVFETSPPPDADALRTHEEIPRPFVIAPADPPGAFNGQGRRQFEPGDEVSVELVLVGRARDFFPYFVVALREVGRIGRGRRAVELARIEALGADGRCSHVAYEAEDHLVRGTAPIITLGDGGGAPAHGGTLTVEFLTQTRLKHEGRFVRRPDFQILFRRLLGRLSSLSRFHCGAALDVDFRGLIEQAGSVRLLRDETRWTRWQRYSSRQDRRMEWEGIVGRACYAGDFTPFWPFLRFGELVHVGHGATFGLGKYQLLTAQAVDTR
jgi:hypothetical protein